MKNSERIEILENAIQDYGEQIENCKTLDNLPMNFWRGLCFYFGQKHDCSIHDVFNVRPIIEGREYVYTPPSNSPSDSSPSKALYYRYRILQMALFAAKNPTGVKKDNQEAWQLFGCLGEIKSIDELNQLIDLLNQVEDD